MASSFDPVPALVFYPAFTCALVHLAVRPTEDRTLGVRLCDGALLGGIGYATWSLTGKAILERMTWPVALADIGWGLFVGARWPAPPTSCSPRGGRTAPRAEAGDQPCTRTWPRWVSVDVVAPVVTLGLPLPPPVSPPRPSAAFTVGE